MTHIGGTSRRGNTEGREFAVKSNLTGWVGCVMYLICRANFPRNDFSPAREGWKRCVGGRKSIASIRRHHLERDEGIVYTAIDCRHATSTGRFGTSMSDRRILGL